jgi:hypothetical protein
VSNEVCVKIKNYWLAVDKDGDANLFQIKPKRGGYQLHEKSSWIHFWVVKEGEVIQVKLSKELKHLTWENEPVQYRELYIEKRCDKITPLCDVKPF